MGAGQQRVCTMSWSKAVPAGSLAQLRQSTCSVLCSLTVQRVSDQEIKTPDKVT